MKNIASAVDSGMGVLERIYGLRQTSNITK